MVSWNKKIGNFDFILLEPETTQQNYNEEEKVWDGTGMGLDMDLAHAVNNGFWKLGWIRDGNLIGNRNWVDLDATYPAWS